MQTVLGSSTVVGGTDTDVLVLSTLDASSLLRVARLRRHASLSLTQPVDQVNKLFGGLATGVKLWTKLFNTRWSTNFNTTSLGQYKRQLDTISPGQLKAYHKYDPYYTSPSTYQQLTQGRGSYSFSVEIKLEERVVFTDSTQMSGQWTEIANSLSAH